MSRVASKRTFFPKRRSLGNYSKLAAALRWGKVIIVVVKGTTEVSSV